MADASIKWALPAVEQPAGEAVEQVTGAAQPRLRLCPVAAVDQLVVVAVGGDLVPPPGDLANQARTPLGARALVRVPTIPSGG